MRSPYACLAVVFFAPNEATDVSNRDLVGQFTVLDEETDNHIHLQPGGGNLDITSHTREGQAMRAWILRERKRKMFHSSSSTMAQLLFPGVTPQEYREDEPILQGHIDLIATSSENPIGYYYAIASPSGLFEATPSSTTSYWNGGNLFAGGLDSEHLVASPFSFYAKRNQGCTLLPSYSNTDNTSPRTLIEQNYKINVFLDGMPVLVRNEQQNSVRGGIPLGAKLPSGELYVYNHFKFTIVYLEDPTLFEGVRITGFDVVPVSHCTNTRCCPPFGTF